MDELYLPQWQAFVRYIDVPGTKPACVYLSGLGFAATVAYPQVIANRSLSQRRSILLDWLGWGFSDRPASFGYSIDDHASVLMTLLDHLGLRQCVLIAHSMGGAAAIVTAYKRPDLVGQLVLAEANLDAGGGAGSRSVANQTEEDFSVHGFSEMLQNFRRAAIGGDKEMSLLLGNWQIADPIALHRSASSLVRGGNPSWREQLYQLQIPRAYVIGEKSLPYPDTDVLPPRGIADPIMAGVGHTMMVERPAEFASLLASILAK